MRARLFQASVVVFGTMPLLLASFAACGDDTGNEAFGGGDAASTATSTSVASSGTPTTGTGTGTGTTTQASSGGEGGTGGDGGSSSSDGGGGSGDGGAGGAGAGGAGGDGAGGGVTDVACDNGCVPFPSDGAGGAGGAGGADEDCDDDGALNDADCQPCNADVYPGQTDFFDVAFSSFGDEATLSFDYDCSASQDFEYIQAEDGCAAYTAQNCPEDEPIITSDDLVCGEMITVQSCEVSGAVVGVAGSCANSGPASNMAARCH